VRLLPSSSPIQRKWHSGRATKALFVPETAPKTVVFEKIKPCRKNPFCPRHDYDTFMPDIEKGYSMEFNAEIQKAGRVTIPAELRKKYNLQEGDAVIISEEDHFLKIVTRRHALEQARFLLKDASFSTDEFLKWRREEANREQKELQQFDGNS
jgi:AbrB family looped-hinge helix DNA binding protein